MIIDVTTDLRSSLASIAPDAVRTAVRLIDVADVQQLFASERARVDGVADRRRNEFATGRVLLRQLLGLHIAIPSAPNGAPLVSVGTHVTLAHDAHHAIAARTQSQSIRALGIDIEPHGVVDSDTATTVVRPDERGLDPTLVFVIKEASYKAWSTYGGPMLEFHDMHVEQTGISSFRARPDRSSTEVSGNYTSSSGHWLALAWIARH